MGVVCEAEDLKLRPSRPMPEPDSVPVGAIPDTWPNGAWTNGLQSVPVKIVSKFGKDEDQLLRASMPGQPKVWVR